MNKKIRLIISIGLLGVTITAFAYYINGHTYLLTSLKHTSLALIIWLTFLYLVSLAVLVLILYACLRICKIKIPTQENLLLNTYSLFVNFFIPGQGGPAFRTVYMNKKHRVRVVHFVFVTLMYYAFYGIISFLLLFGGAKLWWQMVSVAILTTMGCYVILYLYAKRSKVDKESLDLNINNFIYLFLATLLQTLLQILIYYSELRGIKSHADVSQAVSYTGAANLSLFVGLTPGAIGIREAFLLFSRRLHHISSSNIVAASIIDRSVYLIFLGIVFLITLSMHAKDKLKINKNTAKN